VRFIPRFGCHFHFNFLKYSTIESEQKAARKRTFSTVSTPPIIVSTSFSIIKGTMYVSALNLTNFRNYERLHFEPASRVNVLFGRNAQGKSAILEAIYLLATSKSHRTWRDLDLIKIGEDACRVCGEVRRETREDATLEVILSRSEGKSVRINKVKHAKISDLIGQLNAVIFSSMDIEMVRGEPLLRRRFLNLEISQLSPQYAYSLARYKRVLDQRNAVLKELKLAGGSSGLLEAWDAQLVQYGATVVFRRWEFVEKLGKIAGNIHSLLTDGAESLSVVYKPGVELGPAESEKEIAEAMKAALSVRRGADIARGSTSVGPHRDDVLMSINGVPARDYGSQGQQRTAAIALKLAEIDLMTESTGEPPVVLLDDVMAELDDIRRAQVFGLTGEKCQTLITTTNLADLGDKLRKAAALFEVAGGTVTRV